MSDRNVAVVDDECQCGRRKTVRHCPSCGSTRYYARKNRVHKMIDGSSKLVENEYRCQTCGHEFIDEEREYCEAPPMTRKLAQQRAHVMAQELAKSNPQLADEILKPSDNKKRFLQKIEVVPIEKVLEAFRDDVNTSPDVRPENRETTIKERVEKYLTEEWMSHRTQTRKFNIEREDYIAKRLAGEEISI